MVLLAASSVRVSEADHVRSTKMSSAWITKLIQTIERSGIDDPRPQLRRSASVGTAQAR